MGYYLWQRYFLRELAVSFCVILAAFYSLYVVIDSANQLGTWREQSQPIHSWQWVLYYLCEFLHRADVLLPFALLVATLKTLLGLHSHGELTALLCSGISLKAIVRPFLGCAVALAFLLYLNAEYGVPMALGQLKVWRAVKKKVPAAENNVQEVTLPLGGRLLYSDYDEESGQFDDVFWIVDTDHIVRMHSLLSHRQPPLGLYVEVFERQQNGHLTLVANHNELPFPSLAHSDGDWRPAVVHPELEPLSQLGRELTEQLSASSHRAYTYREAHVATTFYQRLLLPWLCLLVLAIALPYCTRPGRNLPSLLIYGGALFGLVALYLLLDAVAVLGRRQVIDPLWALAFPLGCVSLIAYYQYYKLR